MTGYAMLPPDVVDDDEALDTWVGARARLRRLAAAKG